MTAPRRPLIPIYLKTADLAEPRETTYYLMASNGSFFVKKTGLFASMTEAGVVAGLQTAAPSLSLVFPKLPRDLLEQVYGFFQFVYQRLDGESVVFIYYSPDSREFRVDAPPQRLTRFRTHRGWRTSGHVEYGSLQRPPGFLKLGDAHSHGDSGAFFSAVDDRDDGEDGLRLVMGRLDRPTPDVRVSFVANGTRFRLEPGDVLEDFAQAAPPPDAWRHRVTCQYEAGGQQLRESGYEHDWR
jgi:hypothetical protein